MREKTERMRKSVKRREKARKKLTKEWKIIKVGKKWLKRSEHN